VSAPFAAPAWKPRLLSVRWTLRMVSRPYCSWSLFASASDF
jgi:hypothetical protein